MRIERRVLEQFSDLAESMLRPVGKRGSRRYAALRPWVQLLRVPEGTVLSAHVGYLALQRIVSDVRIPSSIACGDSWLQACTAKQACTANAGFVEVSLHERRSIDDPSSQLDDRSPQGPAHDFITLTSSP